jgi:hypothetical protein
MEDEALTVAVEALNGIFDVFGEDENHPVFVHFNGVKLLTDFLPRFSARVCEQFT